MIGSCIELLRDVIVVDDENTFAHVADCSSFERDVLVGAGGVGYKAALEPSNFFKDSLLDFFGS